MIQSSDSDGIFEESPGSLAVLAHLPLEATRRAFETLSSPDPESKSNDSEGRRIVNLGDNRWMIVNYDRYREEMRKQQDRYRKRKWWRENRSKEAQLDETRRDSTALDETRHKGEGGGGKGEGRKKKETPPISPSRGTKPVEYPADFEEFWAIYPRPVGKRKALQRWQETKADRPSNGELLEALRMRVAAWRNMDTPPDKIPHPATWLNQHRWLDEPMRMNV
jgi:hypothetical protein